MVSTSATFFDLTGPWFSYPYCLRLAFALLLLDATFWSIFSSQGSVKLNYLCRTRFGSARIIVDWVFVLSTKTDSEGAWESYVSTFCTLRGGRVIGRGSKNSGSIGLLPLLLLAVFLYISKFFKCLLFLGGVHCPAPTICFALSLSSCAFCSSSYFIFFSAARFWTWSFSSRWQRSVSWISMLLICFIYSAAFFTMPGGRLTSSWSGIIMPFALQ